MIVSPEDREEVWVAKIEGEVVGFVILRPSGDFEPSPAPGGGQGGGRPSLGEVDSFYTHPKVWGKGAGRALMDHALTRLAALGFQEATLWTESRNHRPKKFYATYGWRLDGVHRERNLRGTELVEDRYAINVAGASRPRASGASRSENPTFWDQWPTDSTENQAKWIRGNISELQPKGEGWRKSATANPEILELKGRQLLYFRATGLAEGDPQDRDQIGVAEILDPNNLSLAWPAGDQPVISSGGPDNWDADILDPAAVEFNGEVFLYFSALGPGEDSIGLARSGDGLTFGPSQRIMPGRAPEAIFRDGRVWLFSQVLHPGGGYEVRLFVSDDGVSFKSAQDEPVFRPSLTGWDAFSVVTMRIFEEEGTYYTLYGGSDSRLDEPEGFGLARSTDLIHWERHPGNPIFGLGPAGSPDKHTLWFPALLKTARGWKMLYEGGRHDHSGEIIGSICLARVDA